MLLLVVGVSRIVAAAPTKEYEDCDSARELHVVMCALNKEARDELFA